MKQKNIIVGIDFGSSLTGYTYSFKGKNNNEIYYGKFEGTGANYKTLNQVIINDSNEVVKYGHEAKEYLEKGNLKKNEHFYERIKMNLYSEKYTIKSINSQKEIKIVDLIYIILDYIKKKAIESIISSSRGFEDEYKYNEENENIRWVLTIPAIWKDKNKNIMMEAATKAGLVSDNQKNLFFALEPEAASYHCEKEMPIDNDIFLHPYIICDLGGGTGDIVCHERKIQDGEKIIIEKYEPKGGPFGSDEINKNFENQVLKSIFGNDLFEKLNQKFKESLEKGQKNFSKKYITLKQEINHFKESIDEKNYMEESFPIDCSILYNVCGQINIEEAIKKYNENCKNGWDIKEFGEDEDDKTISFPYKIIYDLTREIAEEISKIIIEIITQVNDVSAVFYVGGFCNSNFIVNSIRKFIENKYPDIKHLRPPHPGNSVLRGAVLYGLDPERIKSRKAKYSLGMSAYLDWESKYENGGEKYYDSEFGKYVCKNAFYNFISKNEDIPNDKCIKKPLRLRNYGNGVYGGELIIYKSTKEKTLFIDEDCVEEIGRFQLKIDNEENYEGNDRIFYVKLELGGTFLNATAIHEKSNTKKSMDFKY